MSRQGLRLEGLDTLLPNLFELELVFYSLKMRPQHFSRKRTMNMTNALSAL